MNNHTNRSATIISGNFKVVHSEEETLNTFDELTEVFENWHIQLRVANFERFTDLPDEVQEECEPDSSTPHQDYEPGGMS